MLKGMMRRLHGPPKEKPKDPLPPSLFGSRAEVWEAGDSPRLIEVFRALETTPALRKFLAEKIIDQLGREAGESAEWLAHDMAQVSTDAAALRHAKLIDRAFGAGAFRKVSFAVTGGAAEKNILKILKRDLHNDSFESMVEEGMYMTVKAEYGVQWNLEKTGRDMWQNFFDGNGGTLDGVEALIEEVRPGRDGALKLTLKGAGEYDWRELVHMGATTKQESDTTAGGFGEGAKILSLILLRDYGAQEVTFSAGDWKLDFYLDTVPKGSYAKEDKGLFVKKRSVASREGNTLSIVFPAHRRGDIEKLIQSKNLFYSSENSDFHGPSYEKKGIGGFKVLPRVDAEGNLYIAGQRMHYDNREKWGTVENLHLWSWRKTLPKDRDRGMVTRSEVEKNVIDPIVESMTIEEAEKTVMDFKPMWEKFVWTHEAGYKLLEKVVEKLAKAGVKLSFEKEYIANNIPFDYRWITDALKSKGNKVCPNFMAKIGMPTATERFKEWQSHIRVEASEGEKGKMQLLYEAAKAIGLDSGVLKEVWLFSAKNEKSLVHGQYNDMFFWMAQEAFSGEFLDALHTYVHEAAHKDGPHGNAKFDYTLQNYIARIQHFILKEGDRFREFEAKWASLAL